MAQRLFGCLYLIECLLFPFYHGTEEAELHPKQTLMSSVQELDIPKKVHFCWLSNDPYPVLIKNCLSSWKKHLPGYEFVHWDLEKAEAIDSLWLKQAIAAKKYAFAADFIRIYALFHFGGIYLDADVELLGSPDPFLHHQFFIGCEFGNDLEPAIFGSVVGHPILNDLLGYYRERPFIKSDGEQDIRRLPLIFNEVAARFGIKINGEKQILEKEGIAVYPCEIFSPKNIYFEKIKSTPATVAIHHFDGSWFRKNLKYRIKNLIHQTLFILVGKKFHNKIIRSIRAIHPKSS